MEILCALLIIGDSHGPQETFSLVVDRLLEEYSSAQYNAILHTGDSIEEYNLSSSIQQLNRLRDLNLIITRGNHDRVDHFNEQFRALPYSVEICPNVVILNIDSNREYMSQASYIRREILNDPQKQYVVLMHHNLITCSNGNFGRSLWRELLESTLRSQDIIVHGHSHVDTHYTIDNNINVICASRANKKRYDCINQQTMSYCYDNRELSYTILKLNNNLQWFWEVKIVESVN